MTDVNDRVFEAVREVMLTRPGTSPELALRFALEADVDLRDAYHRAGDDATDPGFNHPEPNTVRAVPIASVGVPRHRHFSELPPDEQRMRLRQMSAAEPQVAGRTYLHRLGGPDVPGSGFYEVLS